MIIGAKNVAVVGAVASGKKVNGVFAALQGRDA